MAKGRKQKDADARGDHLAGRLRVAGGNDFDLDRIDPDDEPHGLDKDDAHKALAAIQERLDELQEMLYAQAAHAVLVVFQAMDTGGKDGTIRRVFGPLNPQGVAVANFKQPSAEELAHDYLWRIHRQVPPKGMIRIFNRSHYEDVLIARVHALADKRTIAQRYDQINLFEKYLSENGVLVLKFFLHISRDEQKQRLRDRLDRPDKHWKFDSGDLAERALWDDYMTAYQDALRRCSTAWAPWYVIPANRKWYRDYAVARLVLDGLERLDLGYPPAETGLDGIRIAD